MLRAPLPLTAPPPLRELPDTPATEAAPLPPPTVVTPTPAEPPRITLRLTLPPGYAASSVRGMSAPAGPSHVPAPGAGAAAVIPVRAGAAEHAVLASIQRDELAAVEREQ